MSKPPPTLRAITMALLLQAQLPSQATFFPFCLLTTKPRAGLRERWLWKLLWAELLLAANQAENLIVQSRGA